MKEPNCSIARSLEVLGERWTFLILREALSGATRFAQFREALGIAPDVLTDRLSTLVEYGVLAREPYQEPGRRSRFAYRLTTAGRELLVVLGALQQWGDEYLPRPGGPTIVRQARDTGRPLHVGYIDDESHEVALPARAASGVRWLPRQPGDRPGATLTSAVAAWTPPPGAGQVWAACEAVAVRDIRSQLLGPLGWPADRILTRGYWRAGEVNHPDHDYGEDAL